MSSAKKITLPAVLAALSISMFVSGVTCISNAAPSDAQPVSTKVPAKPPVAEKKEPEKKEAAKAPEVNLDNAVSVSADDLVKRPHEYLNKTVKFTAAFSSFSNLALDYKPAMRSSKTHLSLLVLTPNAPAGSKIPLSELKLAMAIPKDKDPETELLAKLKEGDTIEIVGKEFSTALDDPWVEIFKLKKIGGSKDEDKKVASKDESDKTKAGAKSEAKTDEKSGAEGKSNQ